jgi:hypothetical protein
MQGRERFKTVLMQFVVSAAVCFCVPAFSCAASSYPAAAAPADPPKTDQAATQVLSGAWKLNSAQSDDPELKVIVEDGNVSGGGPTGAPTADQIGGNGHTGRLDPSMPSGGTGGTPGMSVAGMGMGPGGGAGGMGGGGGPIGGDARAAQSHPGESDKDREARIGYLLPATSLIIDQKGNELDFTDDKSRTRVFYTDGRKLQKAKDKDKRQEVSAHWDAGHLATDERTPRGGNLTREFALSADGHQLFETIEVDSSRIYAPTVLHYVYDAAPAEK